MATLMVTPDEAEFAIVGLTPRDIATIIRALRVAQARAHRLGLVAEHQELGRLVAALLLSA